MRFAVLIIAWLCLAAPMLGHAQLPQQPLPPPTGEERAKMLEGIRASYPTIPDRIANIMADARRRLGQDSNCEMLRWLVDPSSGAKAEVKATADRYVEMGCPLAPPGLTAEAARQKLGDKALALDVSADQIVVIARSDEPTVEICCSRQGQLQRLGESDIWAAAYTLPELDKAILSFFVMGEGPGRQPAVYRGPKAPPEPAEKRALRGQVVDREFKSQALGETRKLVIYLPPTWSRDSQWPAVFLADGLAEQYAPMVEAMIDARTIRPIVLISAESGEQGVVGPAPTQYGADLRSAEYLRDFPGAGDRFDRHLKFFAEELPVWAQAEYGVSKRREDVAVAGYSNGGVLAAWVGLYHPGAFGHAVAMSPGWLEVKAEDLRKAPKARFFMSAGLYEEGFAQTARKTEAALRDAGYQVSGRYLAAGHSPDQWEVVFHDALLEIFSTAPASAGRIAATN